MDRLSTGNCEFEAAKIEDDQLRRSKFRTRARRKADGRNEEGRLLASRSLYCLYLMSVYLLLATFSHFQPIKAQQKAQSNKLPDLVSATSDEPIVAIVGQDAFISCVAKNLQNYTIIWRFTNEANAPALDAASGTTTTTPSPSPSGSPINSELGAILTAGRQRVTSDNRFSVIQSHDTWLLKITNVALSDTGTYICSANSEPRVRALRVLSVIKPSGSSRQDIDATGEY